MRQGMFSQQQSFNRVAADDKGFWNTPAAPSSLGHFQRSARINSGSNSGTNSASARRGASLSELERSDLNRNDVTGSVEAVANPRELPDVTGFLVVVLVTLGLFVVPVGATIMQGPAIVASIFGR
jgi:hypothetical protein